MTSCLVIFCLFFSITRKKNSKTGKVKQLSVLNLRNRVNLSYVFNIIPYGI